MKVRIINQPTGLLNAVPWPEAGEEMDLPDAVAVSMAEAGQVEVIAKKAAENVEKRPASTKRTETRQGRG